MEFRIDRVNRRPVKPLTNCVSVEGTLTLADYDASLTIVFPGGQKAELQWRIDTPSLDLCFGQPVDVFNDGPDMEPAPAKEGRPEQHTGVVQLVIPLPREYAPIREKAQA